MEPSEVYLSKRKNFIRKTPEYFGFLVSQLGFGSPVHDSGTQSNGVIISDRFTFINSRLNRIVVVSNNYHPVDYGYEVILKENGEDEMIHSVLAKDQDIEQEYLKRSAEIILKGYSVRLSKKSLFKRESFKATLKTSRSDSIENTHDS